MKTLRMIGLAVIAILMSVNFISCKDDDESDNNSIVGTWVYSGKTWEDSWTFKKDGSFTEASLDLDEPEDSWWGAGTYTYNESSSELVLTYKTETYDGETTPYDEVSRYHAVVNSGKLYVYSLDEVGYEPETIVLERKK